MVRSSHFYRESTFAERKKLWDPEKELQMVNPDRGLITCRGHAPSQGRRCRNPIRVGSRNAIAEIFDEIEGLRPDSHTVTSQLRTVLDLGLCYLHGGQSEKIIALWQQKLGDLASRTRKAQPTKAAPTDSKSKVKYEEEMEDLREQVRILQEKLKNLQGAAKERRHAYTKQEEPVVKEEEDDEQERLEREQLEREREKKERQEREEKERQEREERERKEREEKERKEREEKERRQREQAEWSERLRQRAQKRREDEQRAKEERERKAREEWDSVCLTYQERWEHFKSSAPNAESVRDAVPWPVKSFSPSDVNASNVREFLREAASRGGNMSRFLRKECMKWHPDRKMLQNMMGVAQLSEVDQMMVDMICRVVTELLDSI